MEVSNCGNKNVTFRIHFEYLFNLIINRFSLVHWVYLKLIVCHWLILLFLFILFKIVLFIHYINKMLSSVQWTINRVMRQACLIYVCHLGWYENIIVSNCTVLRLETIHKYKYTNTTRHHCSCSIRLAVHFSSFIVRDSHILIVRLSDPVSDLTIVRNQLNKWLHKHS